MTSLQQMALSLFIRLILGSEFFTRVEASVHRWAEQELLDIKEDKRGATKRHAVMLEIKELGIKGSEWAVRAAIEIAVGKMKGFNVNT